MTLSENLLGRLVELTEKAHHKSGIENQIAARALAIHKQKGGSPQAILDSPYFNSLSWDAKKKFIEDNKEYLGQNPKFNLKSVAIGTLGAGTLAATGTLLHQITTKTTSQGLKLNPWALGGAAVAGTLVGGVMNLMKSKQEYERDKTTQRNIDDAINLMVLRGMQPQVTRVNILNKIENEFENKPLEYGRALSNIDFDSLDKEVKGN